MQTRPLAKINGSYVEMMGRLFESSVGMTNLSTHPYFKNALLLDAESAGLKQTLKQTDVNNLSTLSGEIDAQIKQLQQIKSTVSFGNNFALQSQPLKQDVAKLIETHNNLISDTNELIRDQHKTFVDIFRKYNEQKLSLSEFEKELEKLKNKHKELTKNVTQLLETKQTLQYNLENLHRETAQMLAAARGENYQLPITPQIGSK